MALGILSLESMFLGGWVCSAGSPIYRMIKAPDSGGLSLGLFGTTDLPALFVRTLCSGLLLGLVFCCVVGGFGVDLGYG